MKRTSNQWNKGDLTRALSLHQMRDQCINWESDLNFFEKDAIDLNGLAMNKASSLVDKSRLLRLRQHAGKLNVDLAHRMKRLKRKVEILRSILSDNGYRSIPNLLDVVVDFKKLVGEMNVFRMEYFDIKENLTYLLGGQGQQKGRRNINPQFGF